MRTTYERAGLQRLGSPVIRTSMGSLLVFSAMTLATSSIAQSFSCPYGTQPSCLDYGDTVCSSRGMCVDRDASCFEPYQCDYEGFTCKSNLTECVEVHDDLVRKHNALIDGYNDLLEEHSSLTERYRRATAVIEELDVQNDRMRSDLTNLDSCLRLATTLDLARACLP